MSDLAAWRIISDARTMSQLRMGLMRHAVVVAVTILSCREGLSATDASWLLAYTGKSTNDLIWDKRAEKLIHDTLPKDLAKELRPALGGPPDPVFVVESRYVSASACFPHWAYQKGFLWVDTKTGTALGAYAEGHDTSHGAAIMGNWRYTLTLGSATLTADDIPSRASQSLRDWITDHDLALDSVEFVGGDGTVRQLDPSAYTPRERFHPPADGPSFDCAKALSQTEADICANPTLAKLDLELARLYEQIHAGVGTQPAQDQLRQLQRQWLRRRNQLCLAAADRPACLAEEYRRQRAALENWVPVQSKPHSENEVSSTTQ
jgi:uncharacterized protein YecT (DUF1311 family)